MRCQGCNRQPCEIPEYLELAWYEQRQPRPTDEEINQVAWEEEGTLNTANGHFLCNACYIRAGMPTAPGGWVTP